MATIPLLPGLKEQNQIAIVKRGEWNSDAQNTLPNLVQSLKVSANHDSRISSIPDVWARTRLYEIVLHKEDHPLHEKYKAEWRGILTMMALRQIRGFDKIQLQTVVVPEITQLKDDDPEFLKVIARSLPDDYRENENDPTLKAGEAAKLQVVSYDDFPLAICWPNILICPALDLDKHRDRDVAWWKQDGLHDPISELNDEEKNSLYAWLDSIINNSNNSMLVSLLSEFKNDIKDALGTKYQADFSIQSSDSQSLGITGICNLIDRPIRGKISGSFLKSSNVRLINQKKSDAKELLVLAMDIERQWNKNASDIVVGGYVTVSAVLPRATGIILDHQRLGDDIDLNDFNAEIHMVDEFFTEKLAVIYNSENVFPNTIVNKVYSFKGSDINIIPPIKKELLDYLDTTYIANNISYSMLEDGVEVSLTVPVSGFDAKGKLLTARKVYRMDQDHDDIIPYDDLPVVQIWPNFRFKEPKRWQAYFSYYDSLNTNTFYAEPIWNEVAKRFVTTNLGNNAEIHRGTMFPEGIHCVAKIENYTGTEEEIDIGVLLLQQPKELINNTPNKTCKIGIDFGTTNTVVYSQIDNLTPEAVKFQDRMYDVINSGSEDSKVRSASALRRYFIADSDQPNGSNKSIKTMFNQYYGDFNGDINQPLFVGNIYYMDNSSNITEDKEILDSIHTDDMKWDNNINVATMQNMTAFLMQLGMQAMAEAILQGANKVDWLYSYPTSFSKKKIRQYQQSWNITILNQLKAISNVDMTIQKPQTESISVAEYFVGRMRATTNTGIVCIDIGGGSTDIAVWQGRNNASMMQKQTSIKFAGRSIIDDYLWHKKENGCNVLNQLRTNEKDFNDLLDNLANAQDKHVFDIQLESILNYYGDDILKNLPMKSTTDEVATMIRDLSFALSGIFYYVGILVGYLRQIKTYTETRSLPTCYVGGNASKLLDWASEGKFDEMGMINDVFKACFIEGVQQQLPNETVEDNGSFCVKQSDVPKQEVAYGLVDSKNLPMSNGNTDVIAGETFMVDGKDGVQSDVITSQDILDTVQIDPENPVSFMNFLNTFNREMKDLGYDTVNIADRDLLDICAQVNQHLVDVSDEAQNDVEKVTLEPIFILILREVYGRLGSDY